MCRKLRLLASRMANANTTNLAFVRASCCRAAVNCVRLSSRQAPAQYLSSLGTGNQLSSMPGLSRLLRGKKLAHCNVQITCAREKNVSHRLD